MLLLKHCLVFKSPLIERLERSTEVQTFAPIMWHIGPQQGFSLAAFPPYLPSNSIPIYSGKDPPPFHLLCEGFGLYVLAVFSLLLVCLLAGFQLVMKRSVTKKKKKKRSKF